MNGYLYITRSVSGVSQTWPGSAAMVRSIKPDFGFIREYTSPAINSLSRLITPMARHGPKPCSSRKLSGIICMTNPATSSSSLNKYLIGHARLRRLVHHCRHAPPGTEGHRRSMTAMVAAVWAPLLSLFRPKSPTRLVHKLRSNGIAACVEVIGQMLRLGLERQRIDRPLVQRR